MIIDSHQHFWRYDPVLYDWITAEMSVLKKDFLPDDLYPVLMKNGIGGCVSVQADQSERETEFLAQLADKGPFIRGVIGWVDLRSSNLRERLEYFSTSKKIKGFRHILQAEPPGYMTDEAFIQGVNTLSDFGFTYDLLIYHHQLDEALMFLSRTPAVKIVIDHMAKPSIRTREKTHWELRMAAASTYPNVYCKLSGMVTEAHWKDWKKDDFFPFMDEVFEAFGPERILYGSDWPVCLLAAGYDEQLSIVTDYISRLTKEEKEGVMGRNAKRFYNLE